MEIRTETLKRLMEIGYVAAGSGLYSDAETIFAGIQAVRPDSEMPQIGWAVVRMNAGLHDDATKILRNVIDQKPESDLTKSFLGLALRLAGMSGQSESILQEVVDANRDETAVAMARSLLDGQNQASDA